MNARLKRITIPQDKRVICISDIHGSLNLLVELMDKVGYSSVDILVLLGDLYTKGEQGHETLKYVMSLSKKENVHILRGNCDWYEPYLNDSEKTWLENLPHIIESEDYIFVHGGLEPGRIEEQEPFKCMKNDAFMEKALVYTKYVITGHWPTINYTHEIPACNPIIDNEKRIIAIDGGTVIKSMGQLNAFIIDNGTFSYKYTDSLPLFTVYKPQTASGGELNITWNDRYVELLEKGSEFSLFKHKLTGKQIVMPNDGVWEEENGALCGCVCGTDYFLPVSAGETVSLVKRYRDRILAKKDGIVGWIYT